MLCLVCPLRNGGSSSTSSISKSSSEREEVADEAGGELSRAWRSQGQRAGLGQAWGGSSLFLTLFIINFGKNPSLIIKVGELFLGQDVGSDHLEQRQKVSA